MLDLILGPLVWLAFAGFFGGTAYKLIAVTMAARRDKIVLPTMDARFGARSVLHWVLPFGAHAMRRRPLFTALSFVFHACLVVTPLLAMGHAVLWKQSWGVPWWSLPPGLTHVATAVVVVVGGLLLLRRLTVPDVRRVTTARDVLVLLLVISPFLTGFIAHQQWLSRDWMIALHVLSGAAWLMAIPLTRLSHMLLFVFTRAFMGSEFGAVHHARDW